MKSKLVRENLNFLNEGFQENDPILDNIYDTLENELSKKEGYNINYNIEFYTEDLYNEKENIIDSLYVKIEYSAEPGKNERRDWIKCEINIDLNTGETDIKGSRESKGGRKREVKDKNHININPDNIVENIVDVVNDAQTFVGGSLEYNFEWGKNEPSHWDTDDEDM